MGGLAGLIQPDRVDLQPMIQSMSQRGSKWRVNAAADAALADLNAPSTAPNIVGDVQFDNAGDLRRGLALGAHASHSDILAASWQQWGPDCLKHLDGAFAFAAWDSRTRTLFAARDHFGIKPFFYARLGSGLAFASAVSAILSLPSFDRTPNDVMIGEYLLSVWDAPNLLDQTFFSNIFRLPPGHCLTWRTGRLTVSRYWCLPQDHVVELESDDAYIEAFRGAFEQAVSARISDARRPGCNLSGGLDSSTICVVTHSLRPDDALPVFFTHSPQCDESNWAQAVVELGGFDLHRLSPDSPLHDVDAMLGVLGEPYSYDNLDEDWSLAQAAGNAGVDVLLNGYMGDSVVNTTLDYMLDLVDDRNWPSLAAEAEEGADKTGRSAEGYFWDFVGPHLEQLSRRMRWGEFLTSGRAAAKAFAIPFPEVLWQFWLRPITPKPLRRLYREATREHRPVWWEFNPLLNRDFVRDTELAQRAKVLKNAWSGGCPGAREWHYANLNAPSTQLALEQLEALGAANGVDTRFPFLDRRFVEFCYGLPRNLHGRDGWDRWIMRKAFERLLPQTVAWRKGKTDYSPSIFAGRLRDLAVMDTVIREDREIIERFADYNRLFADWQWYRGETEPTLDAVKIGHRLWRFVVLARWLRSVTS